MPSFLHSRFRRPGFGGFAAPRGALAHACLVAGALLLLFGCETPSAETESERAAAAAPFPNLSSVPEPPAAMAAELRRREAERLDADRARAQAADQALRPTAGASASAVPTTWGRRVATLNLSGSPPRLAPNQRADLAAVARLVRGRAGRVRLVRAAGATGDGAVAAITAELKGLGIAPARVVDQAVRRPPRAAGTPPESQPPPEGEVQIYVD